MAIRAVFGIGFAAGYVLGARAGRERYESLVRAFRAVKERPEVQGAAGIVAAQAGTLASRAKSVISRPAGDETLEFSASTSSNGHGTHVAH
jgi:hypothetical protein